MVGDKPISFAKVAGSVAISTSTDLLAKAVADLRLPAKEGRFRDSGGKVLFSLDVDVKTLMQLVKKAMSAGDTKLEPLLGQLKGHVHIKVLRTAQGGMFRLDLPLSADLVQALMKSQGH